MTTAANTLDSPSGAKAELLASAHTFRRQQRLGSRLARMGNRGAIVIVAMLIFAGIDAAWPLDSFLRGASFGLIFVVLLWTLLGARGSVQTRNLTLSQAVGAMEHAETTSLGQARIAVELAMETPTRDSLNAILRQRAIERGLTSIRCFEGAVSAGPPQVRVEFVRLFSMLGIAALLAALAPNLLGVEASRLFDPLGDHPPFSLTRLTLDVDPFEVRVGDDVVVSVRMAGKRANSLDLVIEKPNGEVVDRFAMRLASGASGSQSRLFQATLLNVRQPMWLYATGLTFRSRRQRIEPVMKPRLSDAWITTTPPEYSSRAALTLPLSLSKTVDVIVGSTVELRAFCSIEVTRIEAPGSSLSVVEGTTAIAQWRIEALGESKITLDAISETGLGLDEPLVATVRGVADQPPAVNIAATPGPNLKAQSAEVFATLEAPVLIKAAARDDVRVQEVRIEWAPGEESPRPWAVLQRARPAFSDWAEAQSTLREVGLDRKPGQSIWIRAVANDARPDERGGAQETIAGPIEIHFVTADALAQRVASKMNGTIVAPSDAPQAGASVEGGSPSPPLDEADGHAEAHPSSGKAERAIPSSPNLSSPSESAGGNARSSEGSAQEDVKNHSSKTESGSVDGSPGEQSEEQRSKNGVPRDQPASSINPIGSLRWGASHAQEAPFTLASDQLGKLSERDRTLASRYYVLLNQQAAALERPEKQP